MKSLFSLIFLFLFANSVFAANLCNTSCTTFTVSFPDGGSITAVEPLTFTFGDNGLVDTVATSTPYIAGSTLDLGAGDVLTFEAGGSFVLGTGGNIAYTNMSLVTTDNIVIESAGTISIADMSITAGTITVNSDMTIENSLSLSSGAAITIDGTGGITNMGALSLTSGSLTLNTDLDLSNSTSISISGSVNVSVNAVLTTGDGIIVSNTTLNSVDLNTYDTNIALTGITLTLVDFSDPLVQGIDFSTLDGGTCTVTDGKCIDSNGIEYKATEDGIVQVETNSDSGMLSFYSMFLVFFSLLAMRRVKLV